MHKLNKNSQGKLYGDCLYIYFSYSFLFRFLLHSIKMPAKGTIITRKEYILIAKNRGIREPNKMSTDALIKALNAKKHLYRKDYNLIAENWGITEPHRMSINDLLNALHRYDIKRKSYNTRRKLR